MTKTRLALWMPPVFALAAVGLFWIPLKWLVPLLIVSAAGSLLVWLKNGKW
jgi:hypothetical protein